jgi:hypothetical protein
MESINLCNLPDSERQAIEAEKTALFWLWQMKQGIITKHHVTMMLAQLKPEPRELTRAALNKHR